MENKTINILALVVAVLSGYDAITRTINNALTGFSNWWSTLSPLAQIVLVILVFYFILGDKKKR